jgi:hypothetical protein
MLSNIHRRLWTISTSKLTNIQEALEQCRPKDKIPAAAVVLVSSKILDRNNVLLVPSILERTFGDTSSVIGTVFEGSQTSDESSVITIHFDCGKSDKFRVDSDSTLARNKAVGRWPEWATSTLENNILKSSLEKSDAFRRANFSSVSQPPQTFSLPTTLAQQKG